MSRLELHLPTKEEEESPQIYVNKKLVPLASELYRLVQINTVNGRTDPNTDNDMTCQRLSKNYEDLDVYVENSKPKSVLFSVDPKTPLEKNGKMLKVMFKMTAYTDGGKPVAFRLMRKSDGNYVDNSTIQVDSTYPHEYVAHLPFGSGKNSILPKEETYIIQGRYVTTYSRPVCRKFSLSIVYA